MLTWCISGGRCHSAISFPLRRVDRDALSRSVPSVISISIRWLVDKKNGILQKNSYRILQAENVA